MAAIVIWVFQSGILTPKRTVTGSLLLYAGSDDDQITKSGDICWGAGGYDDLRSGTNVLLKDESGDVVGTASLEIGKSESIGCRFEFTMPDIGDARIYTASIGHRGGPSWRKEEMEANGWSIGLTIGD